MVRSGYTLLFHNCRSLYGTQVEQIEGIEPESIVEALASGELCYRLNGDQSKITWYQTLGKDATPVPYASHKVVFRDGTTYFNEADPFKPGDANSDESVSITDVGLLIDYILEKNPANFNFAAADVNTDKRGSITDVGLIIDIILNEGQAGAKERRWLRKKKRELERMPQ
jgi:hypothetical protein